MIPIDTFARPIGGLATAGTLWIADTVTPKIPGVPDWVTALGLPVAFLIAVIYALVCVHKALAASQLAHLQSIEKSQKERLDDRDASLAAMREDALKGEASRRELIIATLEQTNAFKTLAAEMKSRPCQKQ